MWLVRYPNRTILSFRTGSSIGNEPFRTSKVSLMGIRSIVVAMTLAAALAACSNQPPPDQLSGDPSMEDASTPGTGGNRSGHPQADGETPGGTKQEVSSKDSGQDGDGDPNDQSADDSNGSGNDGPQGPRDPATASATVTDPAGDTQSSGETPPYTDIVEAGIRGHGRTVRLISTFRGAVPSRMSDGRTIMSVETTIRRSGRTYSVYADGDDDGWTAYISSRGETRRLEDAFSVSGATTRLEVPWTMIGGPGKLRWSASSSWTRTTLTDTYYAFDSAPEDSRARYPN